MLPARSSIVSAVRLIILIEVCGQSNTFTNRELYLQRGSLHCGVCIMRNRIDQFCILTKFSAPSLMPPGGPSEAASCRALVVAIPLCKTAPRTSVEIPRGIRADEFGDAFVAGCSHLLTPPECSAMLEARAERLCWLAMINNLQRERRVFADRHRQQWSHAFGFTIRKTQQAKRRNARGTSLQTQCIFGH